MNIHKEEIWKDRFCNECKENQDVKIVEINNNSIALCKDCRKKLIDMLLEEEQR